MAQQDIIVEPGQDRASLWDFSQSWVTFDNPAYTFDGRELIILPVRAS